MTLVVAKTFERAGVRYRAGDALPPELDKTTLAHYQRHGMVRPAVPSPAEKKPGTPRNPPRAPRTPAPPPQQPSQTKEPTQLAAQPGVPATGADEADGAPLAGASAPSQIDAAQDGGVDGGNSKAPASDSPSTQG